MTGQGGQGGGSLAPNFTHLSDSILHCGVSRYRMDKALTTIISTKQYSILNRFFVVLFGSHVSFIPTSDDVRRLEVLLALTNSAYGRH